MHKKLKYIFFIINAIFAIILTLMVYKIFKVEVYTSGFKDLDTYDRAKDYMIKYTFMFWLVIMFDIVLACFKLTILLIGVIICCPCLLYYFIKSR